MKFLFSKKPVAPQVIQPGSFGGRISGHIRAYQMKAAGWLQLKSETLSVRTKWILLFLFCISVCSLSVLLIAGKFFKEQNRPAFTIIKIRTPVQPEPLNIPRISISKTEYQKIMAFKIYMDSLARSPGGIKEYEQITRVHPGLMDSITTIEQIYQSQFKN